MMRLAFFLSFAANVLLALVSLAILPSEVAIHFGAGGRPDDWAPSWVNTLLFLGLDVFLLGTFYFSSRLISVTPDRWINLPNKDYWLAAENRPRTEARMASSMYHLGTATFLFLLVVGLLVVDANLSQPVKLDGRFFWPAFLLFMAYTVGWCVALYRSFRIPEEDR